MRTRKSYFVAVTALSILAARGLYADFRAGYYTPGGAGNDSPDVAERGFHGCDLRCGAIPDLLS